MVGSSCEGYDDDGRDGSKNTILLAALDSLDKCKTYCIAQRCLGEKAWLNDS